MYSFFFYLYGFLPVTLGKRNFYKVVVLQVFKDRISDAVVTPELRKNKIIYKLKSVLLFNENKN